MKARFASIKGACFTTTMMHVDRYSILATTKVKHLHPLAIKARGCTALKEEKSKETAEIQREEECKEEKKRERREHSGKFRRVKHKGRSHDDIETEEQRNNSRRNRTVKPKHKDSRGG